MMALLVVLNLFPNIRGVQLVIMIGCKFAARMRPEYFISEYIIQGKSQKNIALVPGNLLVTGEDRTSTF